MAVPWHSCPGILAAEPALRPKSFSAAGVHRARRRAGLRREPLCQLPAEPVPGHAEPGAQGDPGAHREAGHGERGQPATPRVPRLGLGWPRALVARHLARQRGGEGALGGLGEGFRPGGSPCFPQRKVFCSHRRGKRSSCCRASRSSCRVQTATPALALCPCSAPCCGSWRGGRSASRLWSWPASSQPSLAT